MSFDFEFELLEEQDPSPEDAGCDELPAAPGASVGRLTPTPSSFPPLLHEVTVRFATPGAGLVAELRMPASTRAAALREKVRDLLGLHPAEQRLAVGTAVLDDDTQLHELLEAHAGELHVTIVHVPCAVRVALTGCRDGSMKLWDLDRQGEISEMQGGRGPVLCAALDWPQRRTLTGGEDGCLRLWDLERKRLVRELPGHAGKVHALAADWSAGLALSGSADGTLRSWDVKTCASIHEFRGHTGPVLCVDFDASLSAAISGSTDCTVRIWDLVSGEPTQEVQGHLTSVTCVVADFAGFFALTGSMATLRMWDLRGYAWHSDLTGHAAEVTCLAVHWSTRRALSGSADSTLRLWCPSTGGREKVPIFFNAARPLSCQKVFQAQHRVTCLSVDWDANQAVSSGHTGVVQIWDVRDGSLLAQMSGHLGGGVLCLAATPGDTNEHASAIQRRNDTLAALAERQGSGLPVIFFG